MILILIHRAGCVDVVVLDMMKTKPYASHIGIDVNATMNDKNTSVYVIIPFRVRSNDLE
jgi:hypothetical protein